MTQTAPQIPTKTESETLNGAISFVNRLDSGELLTGTPAITEIGTSDLTITNNVVNTAQLIINNETVAIGQAVQYSISGGNANTTYILSVSCGTDATPSQNLYGRIQIYVDDD